MSVIVSPSLLAADFMNLGKDVEMVDRSKADWIHLDIMDGVFVPNLSFGPPVIARLRPIRAQYILWFTCCISNQENSP